MKIKLLALQMLLAFSVTISRADEGMWIPLLLEKYNIADMQAKGFKLSAEDVYSINKASLKDAVMIFGGGCTGELVSDQGLLLTNYHCGYGEVQDHSTVAHDYLTNGFWAMSKAEELVNPNLTVTFLKRMEDVTAKALKGVTPQMNEAERIKLIDKNMAAIRKNAIEGTHYQAIVKPFFQGNQYFLFVNEVFKDVRLVGAPPSAIGKFGGDTDNWVWPRHTGDFAVFRIYADKDNKPASYSPENVPYKPAKHFDISLKGVQEDDFTMVFGYPGTTWQYVPSHHLKMISETINPKLIDVRTQKLNIIKKWIESDAELRIKYAAKDASIANAWKKWIGENKGLQKMNGIARKQAFEQEFASWANTPETQQLGYHLLMPGYEKFYPDYTPYRLTAAYISEVVQRNGIEVAAFAYRFNKLANMLSDGKSTEDEIAKERERLLAVTASFFKDYSPLVDKDLAVELLQLYRQNIAAEFIPAIYQTIDKKYKGNISKYVDVLYAKTLFTNQSAVETLIKSLTSKNVKKVFNDPALQLYLNFSAISAKIQPVLTSMNNELLQLDRNYMAAQMAYQSHKTFYPDANFTLRVSYGQVKGYKAADAVEFLPQTTIEGIMQKDNPDIYDYRVPARLKDLYHTKDYGRYAINNTLPVCFVATNHTTGGNSGSPVLNAHGQLIGINFDRAWEGVASDLMYNPEQSRNIALDIRYVLFIIDKFAGAGYLLDEMNIVD
jgi:hypothetical protein